jgi:hypothetical protein
MRRYEVLQRQVAQRRGSTVGETEYNIARAYHGLGELSVSALTLWKIWNVRLRKLIRIETVMVGFLSQESFIWQSRGTQQPWRAASSR